MADAHWIQLGVYPTFALVIGGEIAGMTYWVDAEGLAQQAPQDAPLPDSSHPSGSRESCMSPSS